MSIEAETELDAYALLSKPTLDLSDAEVELIVADLQRRRKLYLSTGKPDQPRKAAKEKAEPKKKATAEEKARNTELLLGQLKMSIEQVDKKDA